MKKRAISLFLVVSMSFTLFYPSLSLNDNVLECVEEEDLEDGTILLDGQEISLTQLMRTPKSDKKFKLKFLEWFSELYK